jgi:hypothetical protein
MLVGLGLMGTLLGLNIYLCTTCCCISSAARSIPIMCPYMGWARVLARARWALGERPNREPDQRAGPELGTHDDNGRLGSMS